METKKIIQLGKWYAEFDENGIVTKTFYDESFRKILGYEDKEEYKDAYESWRICIHPDDENRVEKHYIEVAEKHPEGMDYDIEYRMKTKWDYRWFHDYGHCVRRKDGSLQRCDGVVIDINDAKGMNANLGAFQLSHEVLRQSNIGLWAFEFDEGLPPRMYGDEAMMKLLGVEGPATPEEVYHAWYDNIDKDHYTEVYKSVDEMAAGIHSEVQYPWHYNDGRTIVVRCGGIRNPKYTKGLRIEGVHRDVTNLTHVEREKELLAKINETKKMVESFIDSYNIVYKANLEEDSFTLLRMDKDMIGYGMNFTKFSQALSFFINEVVFEPDKSRLRRETSFEIIRQKLSVNPNYVVYYRILKNDEILWHEMNVKLLDENHVAVGFALKNEEILLSFLQQKQKDDNYALFSVDLDAGLLTVLKKAQWYKTGDVGESAPYSDVMRSFANELEGESKSVFQQISDIKYIKSILALEDKSSYSYKSKFVGGDKWVTATAYVVLRHDDGTPAVFTLGFSLMDSLETDRQEVQKLLKENMEVIGALTSEYLAVYYLNLHDGSFKVYSINKERLADTNKLLSEETDGFNVIKRFVNSPAVHPEDRGLFDCVTKEGIRELLKGKKKHSIRFRRNYGEGYLWSVMDLVKYEPADEEANVIAAGFAECDAEYRKEKEQQLRLEEALSMAQSANRAKTTFLNSMSHDIRTPMNAIIGYANLAKNHIEKKDLVEDYLEKIGQSSNHLLSLINDVLDMSRIESGKMCIEEKEENLSEIIHTLRNIVQSDVNSKHLDFYVDAVDVSNEDIVCDKLRLNQVLLNILSNSIKYTASGGTIILKVIEKVSKKHGYGTYVFSVKDTGMGISEEFLKTIYDPFTRVKSSTVSGIQGTGLGMAITKNIVDMMNGDIHIESILGKGTEVVISFDFKFHNTLKEVSKIPQLKEARALVVDDDSNTCISVAKMLHEIDMREEWCTSGNEAVLKAQKAYESGEAFEVYIIDCVMPGMDGIETTRRIRSIIGNDASIIILTAYDWSDIEDEAKKAGVTSFVSKPMFPSDLHRVLNKCLGRTAESEKNRKNGVNFDGKKVLLVEDNEFNLEIAIEILKGYGIVVETAEDGNIAVEKVKAAKTSDYDLILMDIQMPTMNGYEATKCIRALNTPVSKIPIIAMTANAFEEDKKMSLEAGMNDYISKPIDFEKLEGIVHKFLSK